MRIIILLNITKDVFLPRKFTSSFCIDGSMSTYTTAISSRIIHGSSICDRCRINVLHYLWTHVGLLTIHKLGNFPALIGFIFLLSEWSRSHHCMDPNDRYVTHILGRVQYYDKIHSG